MNIIEIAKEIQQHGEELSDNGVSVTMTVTYEKNKMCLCTVGNLGDQIRGLATSYITLKRIFARKFPNRSWDVAWQKIMAEQTLSLMINEIGEK